MTRTVARMFATGSRPQESFPTIIEVGLDETSGGGETNPEPLDAHKLKV